MALVIDQVTATKSFISDDTSGGFMYEDKGEKVKVLFYTLPKDSIVKAADFGNLIEESLLEWTKQGYSHLISADIQNPEVIKAIAALESVRIFSGFNEVNPEDVLNSSVSASSFDCSKDYQGEKIGPYRVSVPLNGQAKPPFVWYRYNPKTGKVLKTYEEKPNLKGFYGATDIFEVGDEIFNDHYVDLNTGIIKASFKKTLTQEASK